MEVALALLLPFVKDVATLFFQYAAISFDPFNWYPAT